MLVFQGVSYFLQCCGTTMGLLRILEYTRMHLFIPLPKKRLHLRRTGPKDLDDFILRPRLASSSEQGCEGFVTKNIPAVTRRGAIHGGSRGAPVTSTHWMGRATPPHLVTGARIEGESCQTDKSKNRQ